MAASRNLGHPTNGKSDYTSLAPDEKGRQEVFPSVARDEVAQDVPADAGQPLGLVPPAARRGHHAAGQPAEGKGLQDDVSGAGEGGVEEPFAAEQRVAESADVLDVVGDR